MTLSEQYQKPADMPVSIPVFPLPGALLLPRGQLPLNIFEPRYLDMVNNAMSGDRIIGMIQPLSDKDSAALNNPKIKVPLQDIGGAGRITSFSETQQGQIIITLTGICRFSILQELDGLYEYRMVQADYTSFAHDFFPGDGEDSVDREQLLASFKAYVEAQQLNVDWGSINDAPTEALVNSLAMASPYGLGEKQALLETESLKSRADMLVALTQMALAEKPGSPSTPLH